MTISARTVGGVAGELPAPEAMLPRIKAARQAIIAELRKLIVGADEAIDQVLVAMFAGGHCLIQGPPGTAKTILIDSIAKVLNLDFRRIQFTPDLMPSDISGTEILEEDETTGHRFVKFVKGPVFCNILMADEINRTPPKTQAALLEVMQEKQVTIGGKTHPLPQPFYVLATQISLEQEGTYPLPEAQQDRFMLSIAMDYLQEDQEVSVVRRTAGAGSVSLSKVVEGRDLLEFTRVVRNVKLPAHLGEYIVDLVSASRPTREGCPDFIKHYVAWGAGLRASQNITLAAKSAAAQDGRMTVNAADIRKAIIPVLRHRIGLSFRAEVDRVGVEQIIDKLIAFVPAPGNRLPRSFQTMLPVAQAPGAEKILERLNAEAHGETMTTTTETTSGIEAIERIRTGKDKILHEIRKAIIGQDQVVDDVVTAFFAGGHCLITGVPGLAKTLLISSLGKAMELQFRRVQFTPDLMPADITGSEVLEEDRTTHQRALKFRPGPIFTNILLADEINRTPPKTQAALLEAMQEHQVTVSGNTYRMQEPFFVLATQNPIEQEGTYPLPEIQQDRFMFSLIIDYLPKDQELAVVNATTGTGIEDMQVVITGADLLNYQQVVRQTPVAEPIIRYAVRIAAQSRPNSGDAPDFVKDYVSWGASIRASHYMILGAKSRAALAGRPHVSVKDVQSVAAAVLRHRIVTNFRAESQGVNSEEIVRRLLEKVPSPKSGL